MFSCGSEAARLSVVALSFVYDIRPYSYSSIRAHVPYRTLCFNLGLHSLRSLSLFAASDNYTYISNVVHA